MTRDAGVHRIRIGDTHVDRYTEAEVVDAARARLSAPDVPPLAVGSVNLDHLHHFRPRGEVLRVDESPVDWLMLADGAPIARRGSKLAGVAWPRVTGADLLPILLTMAETESATVGFLGGLPEMHERLRPNLASRYPKLTVVGYWAPERSTIEDPAASAALAAQIREAAPAVLVVGLGKPRQELWIDRYGVATGADVLLAFGASADFLAGAVDRAPKFMQDTGLEWLYRLFREPRRLARRYLVQGPPGLARLSRAVVVEPVRRS